MAMHAAAAAGCVMFDVYSCLVVTADWLMSRPTGLSLNSTKALSS